MTSIATDDLEKLQQQLAFFQQNSTELEAKNAKLQAKIDWFEEQYRLAKHKRFGASSEKHDGQTELFNEAEVLIDEQEVAADADTKTETLTPLERTHEILALLDEEAVRVYSVLESF